MPCLNPSKRLSEVCNPCSQGFVSVGESIRSGLGPELDLLLPAIGNLLGDILSLAGALLNALAPAYEILAVPTRVAIALIVHLADTIGSVIGEITEFVEWVAGAAASQEELQSATAATARAIGEATAALNEGSTATERFQASIKDLQTELDSVNEALAAKRQRLSELAETITSKGHPAYQQLERQITSLEGEQARLTGEITKTQVSLDKQTASTTATTAATKEAATETQNYAQILASLQKNITEAQRVETALAETQDGLNAFWRVASGEVGNLNQELATLIPSITDTTAELGVLEGAIEANNAAMLTAIETGRDLDVVLTQLSDGLTSIAADQAIATAEFNLVNPAISDAVDSLRDYNDVLGDVQDEYQSVEEIAARVTDAVRSQGTAFDDLRGNVETAEVSLDDIDGTMRDIDEGAGVAEGSITNLDRAFSDLGSNIIDFVADIASGGDVEDAFVNLGLTVGDAFVGAFEKTLNEDLSGVVTDALGGTSAVAGGGSSIAASLASALTPVAVLAGGIYTLANVVEGFTNAVRFEGREPFQAGDQTLTPIAEFRIDREDPFFTNLRDLLSQPGGAQFLQQTGNTLDRPEVRQFIRDEFPELARELFGGFAAGAVGEGGFTQGNAQQRQQLLFSQLQSRNAGGSEQEVPVTFDSAGNLIGAIEETTAAIEGSVGEALPGSEAGAGAAAESQRRAESSILDTNVGRARFDLGLSTDEGEFELDRQTLILSIVAVHAAEDARIDGLMLGETAIAALRLANDLDRDRALGRATTAENTFTTQRLDNEMDVAEASADAAQAKIDGIEEAAEADMKAAEAAAAATERQSIADSNAQRSLLGTDVRSARFELGRSGSENEFELDRQTLLLSIVAVHAAEDARIDGLMLGEIEIAALRAKNDLARDEGIARAIGLENTFTTQRIENEMEEAEAVADAAQARIEATEEAAAAEAKAEAAAAVAAERQRQRESGAAAGLLQTGVGQARFDLGLSGSEGEFEANRIALINATNAFYDNELANINALVLTEIELDDRRTANELKRQMALSRATTLTNSFTTDRVRAEQDAFDEIEDLRDEAIDAEMDRQRAIDDLRDDALDAERERQGALVELEEETAERILDVQRRANRGREDVESDFQQDIEDLRRESLADQIALHAQADQGIISREEAQVGADARAREFGADALELSRDRDRDLEDLDIREGRGIEDVGIRQQRGAAGINEEAAAQLLATQQQVAELERTNVATTTELLAAQTETAAMESLTATVGGETATLMSETAETVAATAETQTGIAAMEAEISALNATTVESFDTGVAAFVIGTETLQAAALELSELELGDFAGALQELPLSLDVLTETLNVLPSRLDEVFSMNFARLPSLIASSFVQPAASSGATNLSELSSAPAGGDGSGTTQINPTFILQLDDGSISKVEGRLATRSDQGLSPLNV